MPRTARFLKNNSCYYIQSQGRRRQKIFRVSLDYEQYLKFLKKYKLRFQVRVYGYCLIPATVYLIVRPGDSNKLSLFMQGINQSYALYFNRRYKREGKVWGQRYKSTLISGDGDLFKYIKLVEFIPVKVKWSYSPVEYPWSSCSGRVLGSDGIVDSMPSRAAKNVL